jgi:putative sterol carrier protein
MNYSDGIARLRKFVKRLVSNRVNSREKYRAWKKKPENERFMAECFQYEREGKMPAITALLDLDFHPTLPLILLNYSKVAHNTLHRFPKGWTVPLRLCRGTVFDRRGTLAAFAFPKFFNYGEHPETLVLLDEPFEATEKYDGFLGIIFWYRSQLVLTTRGVFTSPGAQLGSEMLARIAAAGNWEENFPRNLTVLVEMIHPKTKVNVDYGSREEFVLIGAFDRRTLHDFDHTELCALSKQLSLRAAERWTGNSLADLRKLVADLSVKNREGFVVRFKSGLRMKLKFVENINQMVTKKLTWSPASGKPRKKGEKRENPYRYLMMRLMTGTLEKMTGNLEGEVYMEAQRMVGELRLAPEKGDNRRKQLAYLRSLVPAEECTSSFRATAGKFLTFLETGVSEFDADEEEAA